MSPNESLISSVSCGACSSPARPTVRVFAIILPVLGGGATEPGSQLKKTLHICPLTGVVHCLCSSFSKVFVSCFTLLPGRV